MNNYSIASFSLLSFILICTILQPAHAETFPKTKVFAKLWSKGTIHPFESEPGLEMDIYRGLIGASFQQDKHWRGVLILEGRTNGPTLHTVHKGGGVTLFSAYLEGTGIFSESDTFRAGRMPNHYLGKLYKTLGTRWLTKSLGHHMGALGIMQTGLSYSWSADGFLAGIQVHGSDQTHGQSQDHRTALDLTFGYQHNSNLGVLLNTALCLGDINTDASQLTTQAAIYYVHARTRVALEAVAVSFEDTPSTVGYGITANLQIYENWRLFTRVFTGNDSWKSQKGTNLSWSAGPTYQITPAISAGLLVSGKEGQEEATHITAALQSNFI